jgi:hypothetical protein
VNGPEPETINDVEYWLDRARRTAEFFPASSQAYALVAIGLCLQSWTRERIGDRIKLGPSI